MSGGYWLVIAAWLLFLWWGLLLVLVSVI